jgi:hypothetical protein
MEKKKKKTWYYLIEHVGHLYLKGFWSHTAHLLAIRAKGGLVASFETRKQTKQKKEESFLKVGSHSSEWIAISHV